MGESDALRLAGRPRGVDEAGEVIGVALVQPRFVGRLVVRFLAAAIQFPERQHVLAVHIGVVHDDDERERQVVLETATPATAPSQSDGARLDTSASHSPDCQINRCSHVHF